jgi:hypothetical protein
MQQQHPVRAENVLQQVPPMLLLLIPTLPFLLLPLPLLLLLFLYILLVLGRPHNWLLLPRLLSLSREIQELLAKVLDA